MNISTTPSAHPLVRHALWIALAFSLVVAALLLYLSTASPAKPTADRYITDTENRPDPFRLRGCIGLGSQTCLSGDVSKTPIPLPHANYLLTTLYNYTAAKRGHSPNTVMARSAPDLSPAMTTPLSQGRHLTLTLDPAVQDPAQTTAACYAGDLAACLRCNWCETHNAYAMYERARVRSLGILVLNAHTGAIEAAASAYTPCYALQQKGQAPGPNCPVLPNTLMARPDNLGNQALEQTAKPGSLSKIIIALALQKSGLSAAETAQIPAILTHSLTSELIDIVMCKAKGFDVVCAERRLAAIAEMAHKLGWKGDKVDTLGAGQVPGLRAERFSARLVHHADGSRMTDGGVKLTSDALRTCSSSVNPWRHCAAGSGMAKILPELFGTGEALASPFGVGATLLQVAAVANVGANVVMPHLVQSAQGDQGNTQVIQLMQAQQADPLSAAIALPVIAGLSQSTTTGSAKSACIAAAQALPGGLLPCARPAKGQNPALLRIAGKTGTPIFSADVGKTKTLTLSEWRAACTRYADAFIDTPEGSSRFYTLQNEVVKCNMVPTKWYAFMVSAPGSRTWDRIVVVLAERNWNAQTQQIDSPNDNGSNVAAEAGLALVNTLYHPKHH